jgi:DNA-binding CsgD family transcriptional regulator
MDVFEQAKEAVGAKQLARAGEIFHDSVPEIRGLAALFISPRQLYHFVFGTIVPPMYPPVELRMVDQPDGRLRVELVVPPPYREATAFFEGTIGAMRSVACHMNLPLADVEATITPRRAVYLVTLPASRTIAARLRGRGLEKISEATRQLFEQLGNDLRQALAGPPPRDVDACVEASARRWHLTPRQHEVLALVARGMANKQIGEKLGCAERTVELHVTELLRKARVSSRAHLISKSLTSA